MFFSLLKIRIAALYSSMFRMGSKQNKKRSPVFTVLIALLAFYVFGAFMMLFGVTLQPLCVAFCAAGLNWLYFAFTAIMAFAVSFIVSIFTAQSELYEAKDNELLLSMPIKPRTILASRIGVMMLLDYVFVLIISIPAAAIYAVYGSPSISGWICFAIGMLSVPFLSQAAASIVGWALAALTGRMKHKNVLTITLSLAFIFAYIFGYYRLMDGISALANNGSAAASVITAAAYPFRCYGLAAAGENPLWLLVFLATVFGIFAIIYAILSASFIRVATRKSGVAKTEYRRKEIKAVAPRFALARKEIAHLFGSANYFLNAGIGLILMIIMACAALIKGNDLIASLDNSGVGFIRDYIGVACILAMSMLTSWTLITAPSVSLEGSSLWIAQSIPVNGRDILAAKIDAQMIVSLPCVAVAAVLMNLSFDMSIISRVMLFVTPAVVDLIAAYAGVLSNLAHSKFDWVDEIAVVKQGISVLITMLIGFGTVIAGAGICVAFGIIGLADLGVIVFTALGTAAVLIMRAYINKHGTEKFASLE